MLSNLNQFIYKLLQSVVDIGRMYHRWFRDGVEGRRGELPEIGG